MRVGLLGPLEVRADGEEPVDIGGARLRALVARLALSAGSTVTVDTLIDGLWGDAPPAGAVNALQSLVSRLRRALPAGAVESLPAGYRLTAEVDAAGFERLAAAGRSALLRGDPAGAEELFGTALALWRGPALADVADAPFAAAPAGRLEELRLAALEDRLEAGLALGRHAEVAAAAHDLAGRHPLRERLYGQLITALYGAGRQAEALAAYQRIRRTLAEELGVDPSPALETVHMAVLRGQPVPGANPAVAVLAPAARPAPGTADGARGGAAPAPTNLPAFLTSFVGRDEELTRIAKQLEESRLVTVLGPGGAGKTRLAAEVGARMGEATPDGRWLVELAPVTDPLEVPQAVLSALGLRESSVLERRGTAEPGRARQDPVSRIVDALAGKRALLILDNAEHLVEAVARLADHVLARCPQVRVLATSREPLGITGETLSLLPPLATPPAGSGSEGGPEQAMEYASVRLLADRGAAARPGFAVTTGNLAAVVEICRRLDGLPLALELAAARLRALSAEQIAARLGDRFRLLTGGSRTALPRHRTLAAVVDWSWDLLEPAERAVLRRLSVFPGGAGLEAAERVCAGPDVAERPEVAEEDVLDLLAALVDRSLVTPAGGDGEPRYRMLETIRAYGAERLAESGEADRVRAAHAAYYLALAEAAEVRFHGHDQLDALGSVSVESDNMLAALRWAIDTGQTATAVRLGAALGGFWLLRGSRTESAAWLSAVLAMPDAPGAEEVPAARAVVAGYLGLAVLGTGDLPGGIAALTQARTLAREAGGVEHPALVMVEPLLALLSEEFEAAREHLRRNMTSADPWSRAMTRLLRGHLRANEGDQVAAEEDMAEALAEFREVGDRLGRAIATSALGWWRAVRGDNAGAVAALIEALGMLGELGAVDEAAEQHTRIALVRARGGDLAGAHADLADAAAIAERYGGFETALFVLCTRAELDRLAGDLAASRQRYEQALGRLTETWMTFSQLPAQILAGLGYLAVAAGELELAGRRLAEAVEAAVNSRDMPIVAEVAQAMADLALARGDLADAERAALLLGVATALRGVADDGSPDVARIRAGAAAVLGQAGYARAYERGAALSRDAALAELRG